MTITEHKRLVAAIPEDLVEGEEIEVSDDGVNWIPHHFKMYYDGVNWIPHHFKMYHRGCIETAGNVWQYARRPAAAQKKRLKDEPWPIDPRLIYRCVLIEGSAMYSASKPCLLDKLLAWHIIGSISKNDVVFSKPGEFDSIDWQNSLERRPE